MITEVRTLIFQHADVVRALIEFRKERSQPFPTGQVKNIQVSSKPEITFSMEIHDDSGGTIHKLSFRGEQLATAMIRYSLNKGIPLPIKSSKFLRLFDDNVGLVITINVKQEDNAAP